MSDHRTWLKTTLLELERQGWRWRKNRKHIIVYPLDKRFRCFAISTSPSDRFGEANAIKDLRKAGATNI